MKRSGAPSVIKSGPSVGSSSSSGGGTPNRLSTSLSLKRKSLANQDNENEDEEDDDEPNENNKPKSSVNSRFSTPFTKSDLKSNQNKKLKSQKAEHYDLASFRSQFRKPLVNTSNSSSSATSKSGVTASASGGTTSSSAHVTFAFIFFISNCNHSMWWFRFSLISLGRVYQVSCQSSIQNTSAKLSAVSE